MIRRLEKLTIGDTRPELTFILDLPAEEEQWFAALETLRSLQLIDSEYYINNALKAGKKILAEGAQAGE